MIQPTTHFLSVCLASALLDHYRVDRPPVPVRDFLRYPPPDLAHDLSLTEALPFGEALWLRTIAGQGAVFVNPAIPVAKRRFAMACALFIGLCSSAAGQMAGLPAAPNDQLYAQASFFARNLLMPVLLLPEGWQAMSPDELAELFLVPRQVAEMRMEELLGPESVAQQAD